MMNILLIAALPLMVTARVHHRHHRELGTHHRHHIHNGRPNILFLIADEMDGRVLDDSNPQFKPPMPNLRKLATEGAHFPVAYASSPQCVPSRTSMMSGLHNSRMQVWDNFLGIANIDGKTGALDSHCVQALGQEVCEELSKSQYTNGTWIDVLAESGYNVNLYGKMHVGAGLDRYNGSIQEFPFTGKKASSKAAMEWSRATGITPIQSAPGLVAPDNVKAPALPEDYAAIDACTTLLNAGLFTNTKMPQFLYCSIIVPHPPYRTNSTYLSRVPEGSLGNLSIPNWRDKSTVHPSDEYTSKVKHMWDVDQTNKSVVDHFRRVYFSMCNEADALLGRVIDALENGGGRSNTYIMYVSDHGEHATENRQVGKNSMLEASSRVPFIITGPGIQPRTVQQLASLHDIYPTILDIAQATPRISSTDMAGESLLPVALHGKNRTRDFIVSE
eukprot:m.14903 g.14903  ORF g.14903 m.14903 type:complete len:445 (+) comp5246_c0_seq1:144-1478(+)